MKKHFLYLLTLGLLLIIGCQKEVSFEAGKNLSHGSLQSNGTGDCLPKTVSGAYVANTALAPATNTITVDVDVTKAGSYTVASDTVNGYYFRATGTFATPGINTIILKGSGTPLSAGTNNFVISYDSSICDIAVTVLPAGAGGPATFTLAAGNCSAVINGAYSMGTALNALTNTVIISVNVTAIGTYNISTTPTNGMTFSASGTFAATGTQTVTLAGSGTPTANGNTTIPVTAGSSSCSFVIPVGSAAAFTLGGAPGACTPFTIGGIYIQSTALAAFDTVQITVTVTTIGSYSITTNTVDGFSFAASGNFSTTGVQKVTLTGTGTPTNIGPQTFTVTAGSSSCTFSITVRPIDYFPRTTNSNWSYEWNDDPNDSLYRTVIAPTLSALGNFYNIFMSNDGSGLDSTGAYSAGYYRKSGTDYFEYFDVGTFIGYDNPQWAEYIFLKDAAATTNWKSAAYTGNYSGAPLTLRFSYTILQKDVPVSITTSKGTVNYTNVIIVEEKYEQYTGSGWTDVTSIVGYGKSYYARGIGLIKYEFFFSDGTSEQMELRRYEVF
jgi:hypothetical protein